MARSTVLFCLLTFSCTISAIPLVRISEGLLNGTRLKTRHGRSIYAFMGIPYAEPPVGNLRFRSAIPKKPWYGVLNVQESGNACLQYDSNYSLIGSEDCLVLNVYTPRLCVGKWHALPVIVFIHGGGYTTGDGSRSSYGPEYLLDRNVILVTMNYRLGVFGFLSTGDTASPGNFGLKDQLLALKWVNRNIRAFGGNPNKVTLFGISAGAGCTSLHALSPQSKEFFHNYIMDSGSPITPWVFINNARYYDFGRQIALRLNCSTTDTTVLVECLRQQESAVLYTAATAVSLENQISWAPAVEPVSEDAFFVEPAEALFQQKKMKDAPVISGNVKDEGLQVVVEYYLNETLYQSLASEPEKEIRRILNLFQPVYRTKVDELIDKLKLFYLGQSLPGDRETLLQRFTDFVGDYLFRYPQYLMQNMLAGNTNPTYAHSFEYLGTYSQTQHNTGNYDLLGVSHADDVFYLFYQDNPVGLPPIKRKDTDYEVIDRMIDFWSSFAANDIPTLRNRCIGKSWKPYGCPEGDCYLQIGNYTDPSLYLRDMYFAKRMEFWTKNAPVFPL